MTPAEELTAAADRLDGLVTKTIPGPWATAGRDGEWERPIVMETLTENEPDPDSEQTNFVVAEMRHGYTWVGDAAYIATMDPLVGKALAEYLRGAGHQLASRSADYQAVLADRGVLFDAYYGHALEIARLINGGAS